MRKEDPPPGQGVRGRAKNCFRVSLAAHPATLPRCRPAEGRDESLSPTHAEEGPTFPLVLFLPPFSRVLRRRPRSFAGSAPANRFLNLSRERTHSRASRSPSTRVEKPCSTSIGIGKQRRGGEKAVDPADQRRDEAARGEAHLHIARSAKPITTLKPPFLTVALPTHTFFSLVSGHILAVRTRSQRTTSSSTGRPCRTGDQ